ncbi:putative LemA family protein [Azospirillaceae bacterium]
MTPEKEAELFVKIDLLIDLCRSMDGRIHILEREVSEIKGRLVSAPTAGEFGELKGRVEEISRRQPTTIAYTPPDDRKRA